MEPRSTELERALNGADGLHREWFQLVHDFRAIEAWTGPVRNLNPFSGRFNAGTRLQSGNLSKDEYLGQLRTAVLAAEELRVGLERLVRKAYARDPDVLEQEDLQPMLAGLRAAQNECVAVLARTARACSLWLEGHATEVDELDRKHAGEIRPIDVVRKGLALASLPVNLAAGILTLGAGSVVVTAVSLSVDSALAVTDAKLKRSERERAGLYGDDELVDAATRDRRDRRSGTAGTAYGLTSAYGATVGGGAASAAPKAAYYASLFVEQVGGAAEVLASASDAVPVVRQWVGFATHAMTYAADDEPARQPHGVKAAERGARSALELSRVEDLARHFREQPQERRPTSARDAGRDYIRMSPVPLPDGFDRVFDRLDWRRGAIPEEARDDGAAHVFMVRVVATVGGYEGDMWATVELREREGRTIDLKPVDWEGSAWQDDSRLPETLRRAFEGPAGHWHRYAWCVLDRALRDEVLPVMSRDPLDLSYIYERIPGKLAGDLR